MGIWDCEWEWKWRKPTTETVRLGGFCWQKFPSTALIFRIKQIIQQINLIKIKIDSQHPQGIHFVFIADKMPRKTSKTGGKDNLNEAPSSPSTSNDASLKAVVRRRHTMMEQGIMRRENQKQSKNVKGELRGLQDHLSKYFTPADMRRSRAASFKASLDQPLEISIDNSLSIQTISSKDSSKSSTKVGSSDSHISPKSPHSHRRDQLEDSLTKYYTPNPNKRRLYKEGEYRQMSRGEPARMATNKEEADTIEEDRIKKEEADETEPDEPRVHITRGAFKSNQSTEKTASRLAAAGEQQQKRPLAAIKCAQLIKRAYKGTRDPRKKMTQPVSSSLKVSNAPTLANSSIKNYFRPLKPATIGPMAIKSPDIDSPTITEKDRILFEEARKVVQKDLDLANSTLKQNPNAIFPPKIRIHCYELDTWYSSPYPQEYACLPILHICDSCLMYLSFSNSPHFRKCKQQFPPGNEIYRGTNFSIFEVDGNQARVYCRNLCLLAKLFIDHKTLYFDIEPFLFYVLTLNDETGCHFVGYFSKEKFSNQKYNLACIVTLPCYQGQGFGRLLIDFSYLLSRREGMVGSPERPLSDLGRIAYQSYWLSAIFEYFYLRIEAEKAPTEHITIAEISQATGISPHDIAETLAENRMLSTKNSKTSIVMDEAAIYAHWDHAKDNKRRIWLDEERLQWAPKMYSPSKEFRVRSPTITPLPSVTTPNKLTADLEKSVEEISLENTINKKDKKSRGSVARRKLQIDGPKRTPKIPNGKIGRKKPPGKSVKEQETDDTSKAEETIAMNTTTGKRPRKKKGAASCKDENKSEKPHRTSSTDNDDENGPETRLQKQLSQSLTLNSTASTSNAATHNLRRTSSHRCAISKEQVKKTRSINSISSDEDGKRQEHNDDESKMEVDESDSTDTSSSFSTAREEEPPKRRKILRKRRTLQKGQQHRHETSDERSSSSSADSSSAASPEPESVHKEEEEEKCNTELSTPEIQKRQRNSTLHHHQQRRRQQTTHSSIEEKEDEDGEEEHSLCSSASPQPIGDRLPIFKASTKETDNLLVNMGGEPDTINMGGEPEDDEQPASSNSFSTVGISSYKAAPPMLVAPHPMEADDELMDMDDDPPTVEHQQQHRRQHSGGGVENKMPIIPMPMHFTTDISQTSTVAAAPLFTEQTILSTTNLSAFAVNTGPQQTQISTMQQHQKTLKIPTIRVVDTRQQKASCSPFDVVTVEMPALDAAERHISPAESQSNSIGPGPTEEEDEAPPMLSPQAEKEPHANSAPPPPLSNSGNDGHHSVNVSNADGHSSNEDSFKNDTSTEAAILISGEEQPQNVLNTSTSSAELRLSTSSTERQFGQADNSNSSHQAQQPGTSLLSTTETVKPHHILPPSIAACQSLEFQQNIPQIRVRSESNVELCTQPAGNKLQRTSSFSGHAMSNISEQIQPPQNMEIPRSTLSLPPITTPVVPVSQSITPNIQQQQAPQQDASQPFNQPQQPYTRQPQPPALQIDPSSFIASQSHYNLQQPYMMALPQQQQPKLAQAEQKSKSTASSKKSSSKKTKESSKSNTVSKSSSQKQQPQHGAQLPSQRPNIPPVPSTSSAALHSQWAQLSQYYQQHQQYPGPAGYAPSDVAAFARQNAEFMAAQQQMNPAYSNFYNQAALYSQAQAWQHAWQMQKFQNPAGPYANFPYEILNNYMVAGTNGVGAVPGVAANATSSSAAANVNNPLVAQPWPAGFNQIRHPQTGAAAASQSQQGAMAFYSTLHQHPPM